MNRASNRAVLVLVVSFAACTGRPGGNPDDFVTPNKQAELHAQPGYVLHPVWEGERPNFWLAQPSPDGRFLTVRSGDSGLGILEFASGTVTPLSTSTTTGGEPGRIQTAAWSPDGARLAFVSRSPKGVEVRTIRVDGSDERVVVPFTPALGLKLERWIEERLLAHYTLRGSGVYEFVWVSLEDGSFDTIISRPFERTVNLSRQLVLSPDGRFLAYSEGRERQSDVDAVVIRTDDGTEVMRRSGADWEEPYFWTADGNSLMMYVERGSDRGVWSYPMSNGRVAGDPRRVMTGRPIFVGASRDALFLGLRDIERVRISTRDPQSGALTSEPAALEADDHSDSPLWAPSGSRLAFVRGTGVYRTLVVRDFSSESVREIPIPVSSVGLWSWLEPEVLKGTGVGAKAGGLHAFAFDLASGETRELANLEEETGVDLENFPPFAFDGETVYFPESGGNRSTREGMWWLIARHLASGASQSLATFPSSLQVVRLFVSPDAARLAVLLRETETEATSLTLISTSGGTQEEVFRMEPPGAISPMGGHWNASADHFLFATREAGEVKRRMWRVELRAGVARVVDVPESYLNAVSEVTVHPSGTRAAFVAETTDAEIWILRADPKVPH